MITPLYVEKFTVFDHANGKRQNSTRFFISLISFYLSKVIETCIWFFLQKPATFSTLSLQSNKNTKNTFWALLISCLRAAHVFLDSQSFAWTRCNLFFKHLICSSSPLPNELFLKSFSPILYSDFHYLRHYTKT